MSISLVELTRRLAALGIERAPLGDRNGAIMFAYRGFLLGTSIMRNYAIVPDEDDTFNHVDVAWLLERFHKSPEDWDETA